ncbi:PLP-dependent aminotransferase family protein [Piscinibacter koreensis]|uniref:PLP-dependent aminotransferase family protein n=1 Tax=Piscinibacter koreensis TaxID=2742824 RepID=A0A7Y6NJ86_9BURK|nr:PLP-dependent aminotransferase family protein [Schlegelella koreensis]NUZ04177.1 PLP-dependent aminotransferase family protein [Schlegelella koreensis]
MPETVTQDLPANPTTAPLPDQSLGRRAAASPWRVSRRSARANPSAIREILKLADQPGMISLAGGLPSPLSFPLDAIRAATARVLAETPHEALQYAPSEGFAPLRGWVAEHLAGHGMDVDPAQVLVTAGSQQGLDLVGKVVLDPGSTVAVETPTYLGALQAFTLADARFAALDGDVDGPSPAALRRLGEAADPARCVYLLPNFQNPSGRCIPAERRAALAAAAREARVPIVEDNPYGELWYDRAPPRPLATHWPAGTVYLGSFSKVLAPGLRLGYLVAPPDLLPKFVQAKQASDLHTPGLNQRIVSAVLQSGMLAEHLPALRARYRTGRDAMDAALHAHLGARSGLGCRWQAPSGGMFFWLELPAHVDAGVLLARAVARGVAFVPGAAFHADGSGARTLRLSFVTVTAAQIDAGVGAIADALRELA